MCDRLTQCGSPDQRAAVVEEDAEISSRRVENEKALNALLRSALQRKSLREVLLDCLDILLSITWLSIQPKAGVLLVQEEERVLNLVVERNLSPELLDLCARVPFGRCLCGKAAATERLVRASCLDSRHEIRYDGIQPHGHYNVPLIENGDVIGVLVLYLPDGHIHKEDEAQFLQAVADILALVVRQKRLEEGLQYNTKLAQQRTIQLEATLANLPLGVTMFDSDQTLVTSNDRYRELYRIPPHFIAHNRTLKEILEYHKTNGCFAGDTESYVTSVLTSVAIGQSIYKTLKLPDGRTIAVTTQPMPSGGWICVHEDITEREHVLGALTRANQELIEKQYAIDQAVIVGITDVKGSIIYANDNFCRISGYSQNELIGNNHRILKSGFHSKGFFRNMYKQIARGRVWRGEVCNRTKDGREYWVDTTIVPQLGLNGKPIAYMAIRIDITARKHAEAKIVDLANNDSLTGLYNRSVLKEKLHRAVESCRQTVDTFAILLLDLDKFKDINDTLGHAAGDGLLKEVAHRLSSLLGEADILARLGGDEFAIIQSSEADQREAAINLSVSILESISRPFRLDEHDVTIGVSLGIALAPMDGTDAGQLLKKADLALYRVKSEGRNNFQFFDEEMSKSVAIRHQTIVDLRNALARDEFELHYQPIIDAKSLQVSGVEALVRWRHPIDGLLGPDRFIPVAEEAGLIEPLGEWILERACLDAVSWPSHVALSVNLSASQFRSARLFDVVLCALVESGLPPERLELEITESTLMQNVERSGVVLQQLKNIGVSIALDDFGTGYSSLSYLTMFPFDKVKIDKSFVKGLPTDSHAAAIIASITTLARGFDMAVTAEGIETSEQCELLRLSGINLLQGYFFAQPGPVGSLEFVTMEKSRKAV